MNTVIKVENLTYDYMLLNNPREVFKAAFGKDCRKIRALEDISFEVEKGEALAVIGANGAGKSTLLKILSGVLTNYSGSVEVNGRSSAILEVSTGLNMMLTGRENIRRHLSIQGYSAQEIAEVEPEIIEFSELEEVIDQRLITYSSGMAAKLTFSLVTAAINEILFIDELLVVGDEYFQGKSFRRIKELCSSGRTVIIASHNINYSERLCQRALWLDRGRLKKRGRTHDVWISYYKHCEGRLQSKNSKEYGYFESIRVFTSEKTIRITIKIIRLKRTSDLQCQIAIFDSDKGLIVALLNTSWEKVVLPAGIGPIELEAEIPNPQGLKFGLVGAVLMLGSAMVSSSEVQDSWGWDNGKQVDFEMIKCPDRSAGYVHIPFRWSQCT